MLRLWPTPMASDGVKPSAGKRRDADLSHQTRLWGTPSVADADGGRMRRGGGRSDELLLKGEAARVAHLWATPTARDHKDGSTTLTNTPVNGLLGRQVLTTAPAGTAISEQRRTLNPLFVEALMGWPLGWTDPGPLPRSGGGWTGFGFAAMEWSRWRRRMRCELSRLNCRPMDERAMTRGGTRG
jgi:hypothetical protein